MASSGSPAGTGANQLRFPSIEPRLPGHQEQPPPMTTSTPPRHSRSTSFFSVFRSNKDHQRNNSAPQSVAVVSVGRGKAAPTATKLVKPHSQAQPPSNNTVIMASVRQPGGSNLQQQLPSLPPQQQQGQQQQQQQPPPPPPMQPKAQQQQPPLHPEIRSVVGLKAAHAHKIYFSGPLVRKIERQPDGHTPTKDEGWTDVWAQLGGTILSIWDMKEVQEASRQGREVPPTYVNVTDAVCSGLYVRRYGLLTPCVVCAGLGLSNASRHRDVAPQEIPICDHP
jgi:CCR4-NOT transcriptional complex subunit CAF120